MKHTILKSAVALALSASASVFAQDEAKSEAPAEPAAPQMEMAEIKKFSSYGFGFRNGQRFAQEISQYGISAEEIDTEVFAKALLDGFNQKEPEFKEDQIGAAMQALGAMLQKREQEQAKVNLEAAEKFLADNKGKEGVVTTESGLQYKIIETGGDEKYDKEKHSDNPQFEVKYKGTLIDGTVFDQSPEGQSIPMGFQVIPGFKEALEIMPVGSTYKLFIPPALAYGEQRRSPEIGPNTLLIFDLTVDSIGKAPAAPNFGAPPQGGAPQPPQPAAEVAE